MTKTKIVVQLITPLNDIETKTIDANRAVVETSGALTLNHVTSKVVELEDGDVDLAYSTTHVITYNESRWLEYTIIKVDEEN